MSSPSLPTGDAPLVTVIVPGRDVAEYAAEAVASLQAQTVTNWRALLVDDGSLDATGEIFARAAATDARLRVLRNAQPRGLGAARNIGLELVETPFVGLLDADDVMMPNALAALTGTLLASGSDIAVGAYVRLRPNPDGGGGYVSGVVQPWVGAATDPARQGAHLATHPAVSGNIVAWSKVSRIELWRAHGVRFPEGVMYEDQIVAQQLYSHARGIDVIPDIVVHWRERADGSSITQRKDTVAVLQDYLAALRGGLAVLDAGGHTDAARARVSLILQMDTPPLVRIAAEHPDPAYRRALGVFVRELSARVDDDALDAEHRGLLRAARLW